jgi:chloride channel 2
MAWYDMVWYGIVWCMVWYGMVWYGMVKYGSGAWRGMIWYGMVWYGMVKYGSGVWRGMIWYGMVWYGMVWYGMVVEYGVVWYGMVWYGMVWYGMVWYDIVWYVIWHSFSSLVCHDVLSKAYWLIFYECFRSNQDSSQYTWVQDRCVQTEKDIVTCSTSVTQQTWMPRFPIAMIRISGRKVNLSYLTLKNTTFLTLSTYNMFCSLP